MHKNKFINKDVAIIGISCRFPGRADTPDAFWDLLITQQDAIRTVPPNRWQWPDNIDLNDKHRGIDRGGYLDNIDQFDAAFYKISPREAKLMDPQQRLLLEMSTHCFQDAGYELAEMMGSNTAVFIGISQTDYNELLRNSLSQTGGYLSTGSGLFAAANRLSYFYNFSGPSLSIDTASSSSLVAICHAVDAIRNGTCSQALAGGINLICTPTNSISYYNAGMLSRDGLCKSFDAAANGYARGEGGGILLLKALNKAKKDGDQIYGVIRGSAYRHSGHTSSITVPSADAQAELLQEVYSQSALDIHTINYIETHGSGTPVGDPIEITGLTKAFKTLANKTKKNHPPHRCGLGSVKSNIGHLEAASGIAGVIKVLMAIKHKKLPGTLHHQQINQNITLTNSPFYIVQHTQDWLAQANKSGEPYPLRAGISSFGLAGVNAHIFIEEYPNHSSTRKPLPLYLFDRKRYWIIPPQQQLPEKKLARPESAAPELQQTLCQLMADILQVSPADIAPDTEMNDMGFDSLAFRELSLRLKEQLGYELTPLLFFEVHTLKDLTDYLSRNYENKIVERNQENSGDIEDIAIIGMAGEFPQSENITEFWDNLINGHDLITDIPIERKGREAFLNQDSRIRRGGFIKNVANFDAEFFNISPLEAELMDPQQRRFMQIAWHAMENAGLTSQVLSGTNTGVFVGVMTADYSELLSSEKIAIEAYTPIGSAHSMLANRISFMFNLHGPSEAIDTACSSSLVAVHRAVEALRHKECDAALVGGVNLILSPTLSIAFNKAGMLSKDGYCKTFDKSANGYVRAESVAAILLKPLATALADGNVIHAVIKGSAVNHGGRATSLTAPSTNAQAELLISAYRKSGLDPSTISYIELHGTGTSLGDPIEFSALKKAFTQLYNQWGKPWQTQPTCGLGSVKSNMGHAEAAAGIVGLMKIILAMQQKSLPASLHFMEKNPLIDLNDSPFYIVDKSQPWESASEKPLRAGVSSFGFGGVNAHVIIEEYQHEIATKVNKLYPFQKTPFWIPIAEQQHVLNHQTIIKEKIWQPIASQPCGVSECFTQRIVIFIEDVTDEHELKEKMLASKIKYFKFQSEITPISLRYQHYAIKLFEIIKAIFQECTASKILLQIVTHNSSYIGLSALLKTAQLENPALYGQLISLDKKIPRAELCQILDENKHTGDMDIQYTQGQRLLLRWQDLYVTAGTTWKDHGVYIITGGCGGLGAIFAYDIAKSVTSAKIIILSRTLADKNKIELINQLQRLGAHVDYHQVDVSNSEEVSKLIDSIMKEYGNINGLIHAAGVIHDNFIIKKSIQEFTSVFASKVRGIQNLDDATKDIPLDFFVAFSSFVSCLGNIGQADYAAANAFMDDYISQRAELVRQGKRYGKSLAINWPLWKEGGMHIDSETEIQMAEKMGLHPLSSADGLRAFHQALNAHCCQVMIMYGNKKIVDDYIITRTQCQTPIATDISSASNLTHTESENFITKFNIRLCGLFSAATKIPPDKIKSAIQFWEYGIDSIMIVSLNRQLEEIFGEISKTLFYEYKTISELSNFLTRTYPKDCMNWINENAALPLNYHSTAIAPTPMLRSENYEPIAIIGVAGRYPSANELSELWQNLAAAKDCITEIPEERWDWKQHFIADREDAISQNKSYNKWGGFINGFNEFDSLFFHISPREALNIDPQERLFLQYAWEVVENAGYTKHDLQKYKVGVFAGITKTGFELLRNDDSYQKEFNPRTSFSSVANRVSHFLDLNGPSFAIDTMCSSSLVAIHEACRHIQDSSCEIAIVGGVNIYLHPSNYQYLSQMKMLSNDAKNRSFGLEGSGFVPGEGVGMLMLKRLHQAEEDGDIIHGVIRSSHINHDGRTVGYTVPNPVAQRDLVRDTLKQANIKANEISYIEAHGTGTNLGDPIEITGLTQAFETDPPIQCAIGSIKSNIGHLEAAAGVAGITKVLLQLKHKMLVPSLHSSQLNSNIDLANTPFHIQQTLSDWIIDETQNKRLASISSFGAGGTNACAIIEEYSEMSYQNIDESSEVIIIWSASYAEGVKAYAKKILHWLENEYAALANKPSLLDIAFTLSTRREIWSHRAALVVSDIQGLIQGLQTFIHSQTLDYANSTLTKTAQEWINGVSIDWNALYASQSVRRVSLPGYPFQQKKIWAESKPATQAICKKTTAAKPLTLIKLNTVDSNMEKPNAGKYNNPITLSNITNQVAVEQTSQVDTPSNPIADNQSLDTIKMTLSRQIEQVLFLQPHEINEHANFVDLGLDSIIGVEWVKLIRQHFDIPLSATKLYDYPTLHQLAKFLNEQKIAVAPKVMPEKIILEKPIIMPVATEQPKPITNHSQQIAIIGMSGRFPGANSVNDFWENLQNGTDSVIEVPNNRWDVNQYYDPNRYAKNKVNAKWLGAVENIEEFDPHFFNLSPLEAECMDPQQRLFMQEAWKALEDACYTPQQLDGIKCGTYAGIMQNDYWNVLMAQDENLGSAQVATGNSNAIFAARLAYTLNLKGPAIAIDTACSSSLVATHLACQALNANEIDMALVGGATLYLDVNGYRRMCDAGMLSPNGKCYTFDNRADGFVPGEAVTAVVLKRLEDAIKDNDHIYGVIIASGINQDGKTNGITAPSVNSQIQLLQDVYARFNIDSDTISYIEAHGTGTKLGDPIEVESLTAVYNQNKNQHCAIGSVKSNVGHTSAAAGIVSLQKVLLAMQHKHLVPSLHFEKANEHIDFAQSPFYVNTELKPWVVSNNKPRRAAISSFGFSGTNAHLVVEEYHHPVNTSMNHDEYYLIPFSAKKAERLPDMVKQLHEFLQQADNQTKIHLKDLAYTLQTGRQSMAHRLVFIVDSVSQLMTHLELFIQGRPAIDNVYQSSNKKVSLHSFIFDEDFRHAIAQWINKRKYKQLAEAWIEGIDIDWQSLYVQQNARKLSLPTYPFAREHYWAKPSLKRSVSLRTTKEPEDLTLSPVAINLSQNMLFAQYRWQDEALTINNTNTINNKALVLLIDLPKQLITAVNSVINETIIIISSTIHRDIGDRINYLYDEVFNRIQHILQTKPSIEHQFLIVTPGNEESYIYSHLTGLMKSAYLENSKITGRLIEIHNSDQLEPTHFTDLILNEQRLKSHFQHVQYNNQGKRQVKILNEIPHSEADDVKPFIQPGGVYWITGGLGGLGLIFAKQFVRTKNTTIILSGRSSLSFDRNELNLACAEGSSIEFMTTDVSQFAEVHATLQSIKQKYGRLNGIIHAAGVIHDALITHKKPEQYRKVFAPKLAGTLHIDAATKDEPLDFIVYFSSIAGVIGNIGQTDYSAANAFLDAFAQHRNRQVQQGLRYGKTLSLNWPLWHEGGMKVDPQTVRWLENRTGILPLATNQGLAAFNFALNNINNQLLIVSGDKTKIKKLLQINKYDEQLVNNSTISTSDLNNDILDICSSLLKIDKSTMELDIHFSEYGIDSILMMKILNELEEKFGKPVEPSAIIDNPTVAKLADYLMNAGLATIRQPKVESYTAKKSNPAAKKVAVISHACRFPQSSSIEEFWNHLCAGNDLITDVPAGRWNPAEILSHDRTERDKAYTTLGGYLNDIAEFDADYFGISDDEALTLDPQHRILLELSKELFQRAGYSPEKLNGTNTSVIIGAKENNYLRNHLEHIPPASLKHMIVNSIGNMMAARISDFYNLTGQAKVIDTACSSSLVAVHDACQSILQSESEMAIAGGIFLLVDSFAHLGFSKANVLSDDGKSYIFDERAKGFVLAEGAGLVMLKDYDAAIRDNDPILGVILGSAVNNDGKTIGLTVPNQEGQKAVIEMALRNSQVNPQSITYLEAHGTGTLLGDPIEVKAAAQVYQCYTAEKQYCALGSVKSNLGHTMTAAGIASLIKVLLSLKHKQIPATIHCDKPHARFKFADTPFYPNTKLTDWKPKNGSRIAAVSSFGFGGTNCHMIIEEMSS